MSVSIVLNKSVAIRETSWRVNTAKLLSMQQTKFAYDPLKGFRDEVRELISKKYKTVEAFCWEKEISKSVLSRLLSGKQTEFHMETLVKIAGSLGKKVFLRIE